MLPVPLELDITGQPWIGDLTGEPYVGATTGIEELSKTQRARLGKSCHERRRDMGMQEAVERGLALQKGNSGNAALVFLADRGIPEHIALRVLSCAAFRRKI